MTALWTYLHANWAQIREWSLTTVWLASVPVAAGLLLALPCGWLAHRHRWARLPFVSAMGVVYTVPSIVMFLVLPELLGTRILAPVNVVIALTLYTFALLVRTVADGLDSIPATTLETAAAMGQTRWQRLLRVQLPLAVPVIGAGVRVAAVSNVSLVSVASVIGTSQLGQLFVTGNNVSSLTPIVLGLILFIGIALAFDLIVVGLTRLLTPWNRSVVR
ncbi:ABC transporter permease [Streptomyces nigra]|uniref:ABC transporter permease n=1 Tax=Streptomyces nigra TaxID=1827580 RepID=UPI0036887C6B